MVYRVDLQGNGHLLRVGITIKISHPLYCQFNFKVRLGEVEEEVGVQWEVGKHQFYKKFYFRKGKFIFVSSTTTTTTLPTTIINSVTATCLV